MLNEDTEGERTTGGREKAASVRTYSGTKEEAAKKSQ